MSVFPDRSESLRLHRGRYLSPVSVLGRYLHQLAAVIPGNCPGCSRRAKGSLFCDVCVASMVSSMQSRAIAVTPAMPVSSAHSGCDTALRSASSLSVKTYRCGRCALRFHAAPTCPDCSTLPLAASRVFAAFDYEDVGKVLIHRFKGNRQFLLARALAQLMAMELRRHDGVLQTLAAYTPVPVPAHRQSLRERGFSPPAELAKYLAMDLGLKAPWHWLKRRDDVRRHTGLTRQDRLARSQADACHCAKLPSRARILLIDDVMTTGSTLHQAATELRRAGAEDVIALVLARTPLH